MISDMIQNPGIIWSASSMNTDPDVYTRCLFNSYIYFFFRNMAEGCILKTLEDMEQILLQGQQTDSSKDDIVGCHYVLLLYPQMKS